jgi:hemolysin III
MVAFVCSVPAGIALVRLARDQTSRVAAIVFSAGLFALYGVSATYHRMTWRPPARRKMRQADHSTIFVLIASTYTAIALLVFTPGWQRLVLTLVWVGALGGIVLKVFFLDRSGKLGGTMYIVLGWAAVIAAPQFVTRAPAKVVLLIVAGGVLYTVGAIIFALRRPNPAPLVFGFHEIWHTMVVGASVCHYAAIRILLTSR